MWNRRDWREFYERASCRADRLRPLRPVYRDALDRVWPAAGFSLSELDEVGLSLEQAQILDLPVDVGRINAFQANVWALRGFLRATRERSYS
jgi:ribosomal protein L13E